MTVSAARPSREAAAHQQHGTRQLLLGRLSFTATGYAVSIVLARALGPADYGTYGVLVSVVTWLGMITAAGLPGATSKLLADLREETPSVERSARFALLVTGLLLFTGCWLAAPFAERVLNLPGGTTLFRIAILDLPVTAVYVSYQGVLNGHRRFGALAGAQALYGVAKLGGVLALLALGVALNRVLLVNALATLLVCTYLVTRFPPRGLRPNRHILRRLASLGIPHGAYIVAGLLAISVDLWALKSLWPGPADVVGYYQAALNIAKTLQIIPTVQSGVLFASLAWALAARDETAARHHIHVATRFALIVAVPACILFGISGAPLLAVLFSEPYAAGAPFLGLQAVAFTLFALQDIFALCLIAAGRPWLAAAVPLAVVPVVLAANRLLIPALGPTGAALSLLLGTILGSAISGTLAFRRFGALVDVRTLGRVAGAALVIAVPAYAIETTGAAVFVELAALGALYLLVLAGTGEISRADLGLTASRGRN